MFLTQQVQLSDVAVLIHKHPSLKHQVHIPPGSGRSGWEQRPTEKMGKYSSKLRGFGFPELVVNFTNYLPPHPQGQPEQGTRNEARRGTFFRSAMKKLQRYSPFATVNESID